MAIETNVVGPVHRGVYAVGHRARITRTSWMAATLARESESLLSHRSGAALAGVRRTSIGYVDVTVPRQLGRVPGTRTYVCGQLEPQDRREIDVRVACRPGVAWEVDFLWRRRRLVLETDGSRFHSSRSQIERDRRKEADLVRAGYQVLRATYLQVQREAESVALMVRAALSAAQKTSSR